MSFLCVVISSHQFCHQLEDISIKRICMNKGSDTPFVRVVVSQATINIDIFAQNPKSQKP